MTTTIAIDMNAIFKSVNRYHYDPKLKFCPKIMKHFSFINKTRPSKACLKTAYVLEIVMTKKSSHWDNAIKCGVGLKVTISWGMEWRRSDVTVIKLFWNFFQNISINRKKNWGVASIHVLSRTHEMVPHFIAWSHWINSMFAANY